ncbi:hypothetical protein E3O42_05590 [Cryobacterium adonitolivorans]|uniref:Uncharacterized protein n=1 Tax=Cryobacterium adonitolivorans TaxID=1259189 RepID=A0A4R8WB95_9MICO|nr:hypothetical protein [Cryobacterium adonitolivorans]TFC04071.1 hypothetical protein E3O42_05590 [Cryobacterium adonitolivorans]
MQAHTVTVGGRLFRLSTSSDVTSLSAALTAAVRRGGAMVSLPVVGEVGVEVLVSPGVSVVLETYEVDPRAEFDPAVPVPWFATDDIDF